MSFGIFTRQDAKLKRGSRAHVSEETAQSLGSTAVRSMNRAAHHPNLQPAATDKGSALMLLDHPSRECDKAGRALYSREGAWYRRRMRRFGTYTVDHVCRTLPPQGRKPTPIEIAAFRNDVEEHVDKLRPRVIIAAGITPLRWLLQGMGRKIDIHAMRGRKIPARVGKHDYWIVPVISPKESGFLFREGNGTAYGEEHQAATERDFAAALKVNDSPIVVPPVTSLLLENSELCRTPSAARMLAFDEREDSEVISFDFETTALRPYGPRSGIQSLSISGATHTIALPVHHPEVRWTAAGDRKLQQAVLAVMENRKVSAHNLIFDLEWLLWWIGPEVLDVVLRWECTQVAAYTMDQRPGLSLDMQTRLYQGFGLKGLSRHELWNEKHSLQDILKYNALDSILCRANRMSQVDRLKQIGSLDTWIFRCEREAGIVHMQSRGVPVFQPAVCEIEAAYTDELRVVEKSIMALPEVFKYNKRFNVFRPSAPEDVGRLFADILGHEQTRSGKRYKSGKEILDQFLDVEPITKLIYEYRRLARLLSTNLARYRNDHEKTFVSPDGRVRAQYKTTKADGGRTACVEPNMQNVANRGEGRRVRRNVQGENTKIVSIDLGQIEARVLGCASKDKRYMKSLWDDFDIHMWWTEKLLKADPGLLRRQGLKAGELGKLRKGIKNQFVFPLFYGSGIKTVSKGTKMDERILQPLIDEFWQEYAGVKRWQRRMQRFYDEHHYIETLTGTRVVAPLKFNKIVNVPIQGPASDLAVHALTRMCQDARKLDRPWMVPIMFVHDDLTFEVPTRHVDTLIEHGVGRMLRLQERFPWINVPITCEVEVGDNWEQQESYGVFRSDEL